jgi:hypothetical protein
MPNPYESPPEEIGSFINDHIGEALKEGLTENWPTTTVEVVPVTKEGHQMFDMIVRTDPITACEMRAFTKGFFRAHNNRHRLG